ncbi:hypothetical protein FKM82_023614, partial [Ascaphus truei]
MVGRCCFCSAGATCDDLLAPCANSPCKNGGDCQESEDYESFSCACPPGWQGQTCEIDINECVKSPCRNSATCLNTNGSYRCNCKAGYTGRNCEMDVDDCHPSECLVPGCTNDLVSYFKVSLFGLRG